MKRTDWALIGAAVILSLGCLSPVRVPKTAAAQSCKRECMMIFNQCKAADPDGFSCGPQHRECLLSCPGAKAG